jgi:hypothetical protein
MFVLPLRAEKTELAGAIKVGLEESKEGPSSRISLRSSRWLLPRTMSRSS